MTSKNLWGDLPKGEEAGRSPKAILEEQAKFLSDGSTNDLRGKVMTRKDEYGGIEHELIIVAPYLNNYEVGILRATHSAETYPVYVEELAGSGDPRANCEDAAAFETALGKVFTSKKVRSIISSLRSQVPIKPTRPGGLIDTIGSGGTT